jgi:hypothetical protein
MPIDPAFKKSEMEKAGFDPAFFYVQYEQQEGPWG